MVTLGAAVPFPYGQGPPPQLASWSLQLPAAPLCPRDTLLHQTALLLAFLQQRGAQICGASPCGALLEARLSPGVSQPGASARPAGEFPTCYCLVYQAGVAHAGNRSPTNSQWQNPQLCPGFTATALTLGPSHVRSGRCPCCPPATGGGKAASAWGILLTSSYCQLGEN